MNFLGFLVKRRNVLLAVMTAMAVACAVLIPKVDVIMEISFFLPDNSPIKKGLDKMEVDFPGMSGQLNMLSIMLDNVADREAEEKVLTDLTGGLICMSVKSNGPHTLYQFLLTQDCDYEAVRQDIRQHYGGDVVVEVDVDKNMPDNLIPMIMSGVVLIFIVLLLMCSSVVEVILFLLATLLAVSINMGSNILLGRVSYLTFTMAAVLQMILSMDYSIIIMNRYRQEKKNYPGDNPKAMEVALKRAAPPVLSSAMTTIVSLLMLMFMRLKIGVDMGVVLSKGVLLSMICNFTVLPSLILLFDKAIVKTEKKIKDISTRKLARFEVRWRAALTVLFVGIFAAAFILQKRTEIAFSAIWETQIAKYFPQQNPMILMYETEEEDEVPAILDTLSRDPLVANCLSYPGLVKRGYTVSEMTEQLASVSPMITEDLLRAIYYSYFFQERTEKLSLNQLQDMEQELSRQGLVPEEFDMKSIIAKFQPAPAPKRKPVKPKSEELPVPDTSAVLSSLDSNAVAVVQDSLSMIADSTYLARADSTTVRVSDEVSEASAGTSQMEGKPNIPDKITYEMATEQLTARQVSKRYGIERSYVHTLYRLAGRTRKPATMSPHEIFTFVNNRLLKDKRYSGFLTQEQTQMFKSLYHQVDSAFLAGPAPVEDLLAEAEPMVDISDTLAVVPVADSLMTVQAADSTAVAIADTKAPIAGESAPEDDEEDEVIVLTPLERLAEMSFSGRKYDSRTVRRALVAAGINVSQDEMDLLYIYTASRNWNSGDKRMSVSDLINYVDSTIVQHPMFAGFFDEDSKQKISDAKDQLGMAATTLRTDKHSIAAIITDYEYESPRTFAFLDRLQKLSDRSLKKEHIIISESAMYKEIKEGFPREMLLLTLLTVAAIFLIVALTFRSLIIPLMLVLAVMSGVYVNVFVSGLGGNTMYFVSYLIVQSILMGATIDYCILFMSYYRESRMRTGVPGAISASYKGASHSILTSGLILTLAPIAMSLFIDDKLVANILKCLASGALSAVLIIFLVLPGAIALCDFMVAPKGAVKSFGNK